MHDYLHTNQISGMFFLGKEVYPEAGDFMFLVYHTRQFIDVEI